MSQAFDWLIANLQNYQLEGGRGIILMEGKLYSTKVEMKQKVAGKIFAARKTWRLHIDN